ncbi:MAG: hypothetical protein KF774_06920 [Planctomyces sp.]|nr:hypothetical protein [Planctomyces sp.]
MRCRFWEPGVPIETQMRDQTLARIQRWWREFDARRADLVDTFNERQNWDLTDWMAEHLQTIDNGLMWEFGPALRGEGHRLVITPEGTHRLQTLAQMIVDMAPDFEGWEFHSARPASGDHLEVLIGARTGIDVSGTTVAVKPGRHRCIDLDYAFTNPEYADAGLAIIVTECLVGERTAGRWIGEISVSAGNSCEAFKRDAPLRDAGERIERERRRLADSLPKQAIVDGTPSGKGTVWRVKPIPEKAPSFRFDITLAHSWLQEVWEASLYSPNFASERFSGAGESFCCLQFEETLDESSFDPARGSEVERLLDQVLKSRRLGRVTGAAIGTRFAYVDLALKSLEAGIQAIRPPLRAHGVPRNSWIRFFDLDLAESEWVGIHPDTPLPPDVADCKSLT